MTYFYKIARITFKVSAPDSVMYTDSGILSPYLTDKTDCYESFEFSLCDEMPNPLGEETVHTGNVRVFSTPFGEQRYYGDVNASWMGASMCVIHETDSSRVLVKKNSFCRSIEPHHVLDCIMLEHFVINNGGVLLHSSFIEFGGGAILFTAPSGVGKSTQARLWCELEGAELVNGDKSAVYTDSVCGIPFSGSSGVQLNKSAKPLAIVYLSQAKENTARRLCGREAFVRLWEGCVVNLWNEKNVSTAMDTVNRIISEIPIYHLSCTKDGSSVGFLKNILFCKVGKTL